MCFLFLILFSGRDRPKTGLSGPPDAKEGAI